MPVRPPVSCLRPASVLLVLALALTSLLFNACSKAPTPKTLQFGNGAEPQDLDPHTTTGIPELFITSSLFEGLTTKHPSGTGIAPGAAERWEISDDGLVWTFFLRPNARWSDGTPVVAEDFVRSYQRILSPALAAENAYKLYPLVGAEEFHKGTLTDFAQTGVSAPSPHTLILRLKHPVPALLEDLRSSYWFPVPLHVLEKHGPTDRRGSAWTRPGNFVGNGPFALKRWLPGQAITVERSPTYWNAANVKLNAIVFHAVDDLKAEERMFRAGQLDVTGTLPTDKIETYRGRPELRIDPYYGTYFYRVNLDRPPLDDVRVRRALALVIDREAIVTRILRAGQMPALHFTPPYGGFTPSSVLNPDAVEARRLLAEAGYPGGKGLRRLELLYNSSEAHKSIAEAIQQMWRTELGVDVALRNEEWKVYLDTTNAQNYDLARAGWVGDFADPHDHLNLLSSDGGNNRTGYANPEYDALLQTALHTADASARLDLYRQLDAMLTRDLPIIPIYFYKRVYLLHPRVLNWPPEILGIPGWQYLDIAE